MSETVQNKFGTFKGVFTPTILTIIGVIMYLRLGWVVGTVGLYRAFIIIALAHVTTVSTSLSMSSLATNTRVGAGGFYSMITKSLGLEAGSAIGIPLYFSQALGCSLYIIGFVQVWCAVFPVHPAGITAYAVFGIVLLLALIGANFALRIQYVLMTIIAVSILVFLAVKTTHESALYFRPVSGEGYNFWYVFAVFFPAVTGIGAGAAMSGDLKDPRRSLPLGILGAVAAGLAIYSVIAYKYASLGTSAELINNQMFMAERSLLPPAVIAGIMCATLSSALGTMIGAPRILMALGQHRLLPLSALMIKKTKKGEPYISVIITGIVIALGISVGDLNKLATLVTMFFLITYGTVNAAVFIEKATGIPSFRPYFTIPNIIPGIGALWCFAVMFLINTPFALSAIVCIIIIYIIQLSRNMESNFGDTRAGMFTAVAEWAAKRAHSFARSYKSWKPNLIIPVEDPKNWTSRLAFVEDLIVPNGTLRVFSVSKTEKAIEQIVGNFLERLSGKKNQETMSGPETKVIESELAALIEPLMKKGIFAAWRVVEAPNILAAISVIIQVSKGMFFPPNILFLSMGDDIKKDSRLREMIAVSIRNGLGICLLYQHPKKWFGAKGKINVWIRSGSPNHNLALLTAYLLERKWNKGIRLISIVEDADASEKRYAALMRIAETARMPRDTENIVLINTFSEAVKQAPAADLNVFGLPENIDMKIVHEITENFDTSCLFVKDSGSEKVLA